MKKGSALLIVLGMLSFMVVSAVGFSIYMRTSRAPSSYLRRNIAARHLVKAALAKAIGELEGDYNTNPNWGTVVSQSGGGSGSRNPPVGFYGIYDDPFPGIVMDNTARNSLYGRENGDYWLGRVFMPFGAVRSPRETVSTLTLEGLAYLPPAIIDDVRRLSRYTRTAIWRSLPYGAGRYAYCAVNVSDMFDINKLRANVARDSGMNRITLGALCMGGNGEIDPAVAGRLDTLLDESDTVGPLANPVPFVSLADFNLVAGAGSPWAPFMDYVGSDGRAMLGQDENEEKNALFITDTWFPPKTTENSADIFDLTSNAQPFSDYTATGFLQVETLLNPITRTLYLGNLGIGVACLYDYLDSDSKPISLALPTVEAVPMVVGVSCPEGLHPQLDEIATLPDTTLELTGTGNDEDGNPQTAKIVAKRTIKSYGITSFGNRANVQVVVASPFKRLAATQRAKTYRVRGLLRVWLAPDGMGCRPPDDVNLYPQKSLWEDGALTSRGIANNGVATFISNDEMTLSEFAGDVKTTSDAIADKLLTFSNLDVKMPIWYEIEEAVDLTATAAANPALRVPFTPDPSNFKGSYKSLGDLKGDATALRSLKGDGSLDSEDGSWQKAANGAQFNTAKPYGDQEAPTEFDPASLSKELRLYAALWIQVLDGNQVVDMVPACAADDNEWLDAGLPGNNAVFRMLGDGAPLLNFKSGTVTYATIATSFARPVNYEGWKTLYAVDPRYNFAPEDWFSSMSQNASKSDWMTLLGLDGDSSTVFGQNGRDRDIFMFVSDQEYLQSIGELQFLPRLDVMDGSGRFMGGDYAPDFHGNPFSGRTGPTGGGFANGGLFWKTYTAFANGGGTQDVNPYRMVLAGQEVEIKSDASGFRVNPFSQDDRVLSAAIAATPFDWYVASTNYNQAQSGGRQNNVVRNMTLERMLDDYSFGKDNGVAKMSSTDLKNIFAAFKSEFRSEAEESTAGEPADWLAAYNDMDWSGNGINDENKALLGATLTEPLHGVDRKYLYSFWRECFDNRQQLFLIFVRAEPASVGGGATSRISSQLGGRAVALVWRDPEPPASAANASRLPRSSFNSIQNFLMNRGDSQIPPHRTRVLFYHQFD